MLRIYETQLYLMTKVRKFHTIGNYAVVSVSACTIEYLLNKQNCYVELWIHGVASTTSRTYRPSSADPTRVVGRLNKTTAPEWRPTNGLLLSWRT